MTKQQNQEICMLALGRNLVWAYMSGKKPSQVVACAFMKYADDKLSELTAEKRKANGHV